MKNQVIELTNETFRDYDDLNKEYIQFFMYAEGGAMGEAGAVKVITKKDGEVSVYHANWAYGGFDGKNIDLIFPNLSLYYPRRDDREKESTDDFVYRYMGFGNHLLIRSCYRHSFNEVFEYASQGEVYQGWFDTAMDLVNGKKREWKYCVIGNIVETRIDHDGIFRHGTVQFSGGTKVYLCGKQWDPSCEWIDVIGKKQGGGNVAESVPVRAIENVRCSRVYKPSVLNLMNWFESYKAWWHDSPDDKADIERFVREWNESAQKRKPYSYSVRNILTGFFGADAISSMRSSRQPENFETTEFKTHIAPLMWQYADREAQSLFLRDRFLIDTILCEDYMAYVLRQGKKELVYLMLLTPSDGSQFVIDTDYADEILSEWEDKSDKTFLLICNVSVEFAGKSKERFCFKNTSKSSYGFQLLSVKRVNGQKYLILDGGDACWDYYYRKAVSVWFRNDVREYECLFSPVVEITAGKDNGKTVLGKGIPALVSFLSENAPLRIAYKKESGEEIFVQTLYAGIKEIELSVSRDNLVCAVSITEEKSTPAKIIFDETEDPYGSLIDNVPTIRSIRLLNPEEMHAFAVQLNYADNNIRNYYLYSFETRGIPEQFKLDDYVFDWNALASARITDGDLVFSNGYRVPKHLLYYHSYRQAVIEKTNEIVSASDEINIVSLYRTPLENYASFGSIPQYTGFDDEAFGPKKAWLDEDGNRICDIALYTFEKNKLGTASLACVEPTAKRGLLRSNGTWLAPPIYDDFGETFSDAILAEREGKKYIVTENGDEIPLDCSIDEDRLNGDRCPFNTAKQPESVPDTRYCEFVDWDFDYQPGKWGFLDSRGNIVIESQYLFVLGFWDDLENHCFVAKSVNGKIRWGLIDRNGKEVIPCVYPDLYSRWGNAIFFKTEENEKWGPYGIMDLQGNVLMEPRFAHIEEYNAKRKMVIAGPYSDVLGVFSLEKQQLIIPQEYYEIEFYDHMIVCSNPSGKTRYFDYDGEELDFSEYGSVCEKDGKLHVEKNGKCGVIDWEGNILIPFVLDRCYSDTIDLYKAGKIITTNGKQEGLESVSGDVLIPAVYDNVSVYENFVVASQRTNSNWSLRDTLFDLNGNVVLQGPFRNTQVDSDSETIKAETPDGVCYYKYHRTDRNT